MPDVIKSPGTNFDGPIRKEAESVYGVSLSHLRVHTDEAARRSAREIGAEAYTSRNHMVFDGPMTRKRVLHEVAHTFQQAAGSVSGNATGHGFTVSDPNSPEEVQAASMENASAPTAGVERLVSAATASRQASADAEAPVQRMGGKHNRKGKEVMTEAEWAEEQAREARVAAIVDRLRRAEERAEAPSKDYGQRSNQFGGYSTKAGRGGAPYIQSNKQNHRGASDISTKYYEEIDGQPSGMITHLTDSDFSAVADATRGRDVRDHVPGMEPTRRRAATMVTAVVDEAEATRHGAAKKAFRAAAKKQASGERSRAEFLEDFPMAIPSKKTTPSKPGGAQHLKKVMSGRVRMGTEELETLEQMSASSDEGRGRPAKRRPSVSAPLDDVSLRPRRQSFAGPSSNPPLPQPNPLAPAPPKKSSKHYPPSSSRSKNLPGGSGPVPYDDVPLRPSRSSRSRTRAPDPAPGFDDNPFKPRSSSRSRTRAPAPLPELDPSLQLPPLAPERSSRHRDDDQPRSSHRSSQSRGPSRHGSSSRRYSSSQYDQPDPYVHSQSSSQRLPPPRSQAPLYEFNGRLYELIGDDFHEV
ncbi:DUF4157 domain-containing protein [Streptomyces sp. NPDC059255]|uniref:eCIS core domain-containing protein n=1 Tax=Streptomyces sp. NPDC059255 TaxID=3346793 RepID=UPI0036A6EA29